MVVQQACTNTRHEAGRGFRCFGIQNGSDHHLASASSTTPHDSTRNKFDLLLDWRAHAKKPKSSWSIWQSGTTLRVRSLVVRLRVSALGLRNLSFVTMAMTDLH